MSRGEKAGEKIADALIDMIHLMYNKNTSMRVLNALIDRLVKRRFDFE